MSLFGLCIVCRRFVPNFAKVTAVLTERLKKTQGFTPLSPTKSEELEALKKLLMTTPKLVLSRKRYSYTVDNDQSCNQVGAVLMQAHFNGKLNPIGFFCGRLSPAENKNDSTHLFCLAVVFAIILQRPYLCTCDSP